MRIKNSRRNKTEYEKQKFRQKFVSYEKLPITGKTICFKKVLPLKVLPVNLSSPINVKMHKTLP